MMMGADYVCSRSDSIMLGSVQIWRHWRRCAAQQTHVVAGVCPTVLGTVATCNLLEAAL
jgi:hypothetical protein